MESLDKEFGGESPYPTTSDEAIASGTDQPVDKTEEEVEAKENSEDYLAYKDHEVLIFWFDECSPKDHFSSSLEFDDKLRERFGDLHAELVDSTSEAWQDSPEQALSTIIVLDQFSRNLNRGTAAAFLNDEKALQIAKYAVERGFDKEVPENLRTFFYMPFMHSENIDDQERSVELFRELGNDKNLAYAIKHREVIQKFGRFPGRNDALGRESTEEESQYLDSNPAF